MNPGIRSKDGFKEYPNARFNNIPVRIYE